MLNSSSPNVDDILACVSSKDEATRKMAVFKLQNLINDPSFAEQFVMGDGIYYLHELIMEASGNTLAYALASFARLLEVDHGWGGIDNKLVQKVVELVVHEPLVNILRGALSVLVSIVARPQSESIQTKPLQNSQVGGFKTLKPAISLYPQFLEMLVSRLSSADHSLCANALQLINSLMRDAIANDSETEWPKFIKRIQDLGVIKAVYILMQSSALHDLAAPLSDFQALTKILLRRWKEVHVDLARPEHRRTIKALHLSSNPERNLDYGRTADNQPKHNPYKWRRLGFATENPEIDFEEMGFLGMMDLSDYVRKHQTEFQHILIEQANVEIGKRCPLARASLTVTTVLFEHFEVDKTELEEAKTQMAMENRTNHEQIYRPLLLHWSRLHVAGLHAFLRLWKATGAEGEDFHKITELIRILIESVVGGAERTKGIEQVERELASYNWSKLRELQMELLELTYEDLWGQHLRGIREELHTETMQFVKEQRVRCLLDGAWFPNNGSTELQNGASQPHRFLKLSPDRRYLHFGSFDETFHSYGPKPTVGMLHDRIDLSQVSSVVSNVTAINNSDEDPEIVKDDAAARSPRPHTRTKISIHGYVTAEPKSSRQRAESRNDERRTTSRISNRPTVKEVVLLTFQPTNHIIASEWLDGLLMLLDQQPITAETNKLIKMVSDYGLKVRLLNVRFNDEEGLVDGGPEAPPVPSRDGLDEDYYYEI